MKTPRVLTKILCLYNNNIYYNDVSCVAYPRVTPAKRRQLRNRKRKCRYLIFSNLVAVTSSSCSHDPFTLSLLHSVIFPLLRGW